MSSDEVTATVGYALLVGILAYGFGILIFAG